MEEVKDKKPGRKSDEQKAAELGVSVEEIKAARRVEKHNKRMQNKERQQETDEAQVQKQEIVDAIMECESTIKTIKKRIKTLRNTYMKAEALDALCDKFVSELIAKDIDLDVAMKQINKKYAEQLSLNNKTN